MGRLFCFIKEEGSIKIINAIVGTKGGTLILDLPHSVYELYKKLTSIGIQVAPNKVILTDREEDDIRVRLNADSQLEGHLLHILDERDSLQDVIFLNFHLLKVYEYYIAELIQKEKELSIYLQFICCQNYKKL